jgi:hypothetical protein
MIHIKEMITFYYKQLYMGPIFVILFFLLSFSRSHAASFSHIVEENLSKKEIKVTFLLDPKNESINAYEGELIYNTKKLAVERIETANSFVTTWITYPEKSNSLLGDDSIVFEGLTPGGFSGVLQTGEDNKEPGILFSVIFSAREQGDTNVSLSGVNVYKNDGIGGEAEILDHSLTLSLRDSFVKSSYPRASLTGASQENEGSSDIFAQVIEGEDIYAGRPFLIFENKNKQKSLLMFQVSESIIADSRSLQGFSWAEAKSPYLLTRVGTSKFIHVRALYSDGTYSVKTLEAVEKSVSLRNFYYILGLCLLLMLLIGYALKSKEETE